MIIPDRTRETLEEFIKLYVMSKTRICSDGFASYNGITDIGFLHESVNHSIGQFVDKDNPTNHINSIEGIWAHLKNWLRSKYGVHRRNLDGYLDEFQWRYGRHNCFHDILTMMSAYCKP